MLCLSIVLFVAQDLHSPSPKSAIGETTWTKGFKDDRRRSNDISLIVKDKSWGSSIMRGQMVSDALKGRGYNVEYVTIESFLRNASSIGGICVCVKFCPEAVVNTCRTLQRAVIWDVLDVDAKQYSNQSLNGMISLFLANSRYHASMLLSDFNVSTVKVAYHHHSNTFSLSRHWNASTVPKRLCMTASPGNMPASDVCGQLAVLAASYSMSLHPIDALPIMHASQAIDDPYNQRPVLQQLVDKCDVALVWPARFDEYVTNYRPITRLVTFWSLGLPTIYYPFAAYLDVAPMISTSLMAFSLVDVDRLLGLIYKGMCNMVDI